MLEKLKKNSVKIFVFAINVLLATIAVFVIREKDQSRLLENTQKENIPSENKNDEILPSFENSVENSAVQTDTPPQSLSDEEGNTFLENSAPAASVPASNPAPAQVSPPAATVPSTPIPASAPVKKKKPADTKTKTS